MKAASRYCGALAPVLRRDQAAQRAHLCASPPPRRRTRIQGKNLKGAWCDEIGLWDQWETTWDESLKYAVRKGKSRIVATGTPKKSRKARKLVRRLLNDPKVPVSRLRTLDNAGNLSERFLDEVVSSSKGTRLERQELEGVLLDDIEGALWTADLIDAYRVKRRPLT